MREPGGRVVLLSRLVIFAADDEHIVSAVERMRADVVIRVVRVPVQRARHRALRNARADRERAIRRLLHVRDHVVADRRVGGDDDVLGGHRVAARGVDLERTVAPDLVDVRAAVEPGALALDGARERVQVLERVKLRLIGKAEARSGVPRVEGGALEQLDVTEPGLACGIALALEEVAVVVRPEHEVAVHARESASDAFARDDLLDGVDGRAVTLGGQSRPALAVQRAQPDEAIVHGVGEVRGGASRLAAADGPVVEDEDAASGARQEVCGGDSGNAGADDADVGSGVAVEPRVGEGVDRLHPDGAGTARVGVHTGDGWGGLPPDRRPASRRARKGRGRASRPWSRRPLSVALPGFTTSFVEGECPSERLRGAPVEQDLPAVRHRLRQRPAILPA